MIDGQSSGTVTTFISERGFGFIRPDDRGADLFFHIEELLGASTVRPGQRVTYEPRLFDRTGKMRAFRVHVDELGGK